MADQPAVQREACGSYGLSVNRMEGRRGAGGAPCIADLPLRPLPCSSPVPLLMSHSCFQGLDRLPDRKMLEEEGFAGSHVHLSGAPQEQLCDCERLKLAPVFTFVGCHTA